MQPIRLTGIDKPLAPLVLGTMTFGDGADARAAGDMVEDFLAAGGNGIDTANGYAAGRSETILADLLRGRRDLVVLASKVGIPHPDADGAAPLSIDGIRRCVAGSLRRLGTDHLDLLYLHQPDRSTPTAHTLAALRELLNNGAIRAWGVSNFAAWQIAELRRAAADHAVPDPVIAQQVYNVVATYIDDEYAEYARTTGLPTVVYNPLAGGLLTGQHTRQRPPGGGRFGASRLGGMYRDRYWNDSVFAAVEALRAIADAAGLPMAELALRWTVDRPVVDAVLIGGSRPQNIRTNLAAIAKGRSRQTWPTRSPRCPPPCTDPCRPTTADTKGGPVAPGRVPRCRRGGVCCGPRRTKTRTCNPIHPCRIVRDQPDPNVLRHRLRPHPSRQRRHRRPRNRPRPRTPRRPENPRIPPLQATVRSSTTPPHRPS